MVRNNNNIKVMVITGGASGLGLALAQAAGQSGYSVAVLDVQDELGLTEVSKLQAQNIDAAYFQRDVSSKADWQDSYAAVMRHYGRVDVMVNNAGVGSQGNLMDTTDDEWTRQWQINLMGVVNGCKTFIPALQSSPDAALVNIASFAAIALAPGVASYNVAKAGVLALSETLRCELAADNIHVSVVCPAFFKTNLVSSMYGSSDKVKNQINRWMENSQYTADDVANMILTAINKRQFMVLCDGTTRWQYRLSRWFPTFFYKQKLKMIKRMFK